MPRHGHAHPRGITLPAISAPFSIREEKRDGAGGPLGFYALQRTLARSHRT